MKFYKFTKATRAKICQTCYITYIVQGIDKSQFKEFNVLPKTTIFCVGCKTNYEIME
jgi:hypothetical protein